MRQIIDRHDVYVVDFDTLPELPIIWTFEDEKPYALALGHALRTGVITEPGKYGIHITSDEPLSYNIFTIQE